MKSVLVSDTQHCIFCFSQNVEEHHVFHGIANRRIAEKYHLTVPLCPICHREGANAPHKNKVVDMALKCWAQTYYETHIGSRQDFMHEFGKNYI